MSKLEHFILRLIPGLWAGTGIALLAWAWFLRADHLFATILFTICGVWLLFWALAGATVAYVPSILEADLKREYSKEALRQIAEW